MQPGSRTRACRESHGGVPMPSDHVPGPRARLCGRSRNGCPATDCTGATCKRVGMTSGADEFESWPSSCSSSSGRLASGIVTATAPRSEPHEVNKHLADAIHGRESTMRCRSRSSTWSSHSSPFGSYIRTHSVGASEETPQRPGGEPESHRTIYGEKTCSRSRRKGSGVGRAPVPTRPIPSRSFFVQGSSKPAVRALVPLPPT